MQCATPKPLVGRESVKENSIRNRGLSRRETPRKDRSISPEFVFCSQISDVELAGTTGFH